MAGSKDNATSVESLETADHLTDFSKMREAYDQLCQEEEVINMDLGGLLEHQALLENKMVSLHKMLPNLQILETDSKQLSSMIAFTSTLAENVSSKVRQLDLAKSRVSTCIQRVEDVLDLKFCTDGVQSALQNEDYETAAGHIHRFLSLDENILRMAADASEGSALDTSFKLLHEAEEKMKTIVRKKFDASVHTADVASVERFFKIFPLLGLHDEGLAKFGKYLAAQISETADKTMKQTHEDEKRAKVKFADSITVLFERIARVVEIHQPLVETFYGPGKLVMLLYTLQKECDRQARKIMERFRNARDLDHKIQQVQQSLSYTKFSSDRLDPKELDVLLSEMVLLNTRAELYLRFIKRRALNDIELGYQDEAKNDKSSEVKSFLNNCDLSRLMQELIGNYILMEEYFMREMVVKAVNMDTMEGGAQTSSMVDDSFYIVKKSVRRAISSSSVDGVCAMLNHAATIFEQDFREVLFSRLRPGFPSGFDLTQAYNLVQSSLQQGKLQSSDTEKAKATFLITLNNAEVSCDYIKSLKSSLQQELANIYNQCNEQDQAKLETCLTDLGSVSVQFKDVVEFGFNQLYSSSIKPRIKPLVDVLLSTVHNITEDEFANYEANDPWMQNFIMNLDGMLANFKQGLTTANYDKYVGFTTNEITVQLEKAVLKITFNRLGGLQFDKELRALVSYLTSVTTWTVRDKFARLTQMATILNLERVMEILDYWGPNSGPLTWRLTPTEVRQILSLRIDFRNEDIKRLKL